MTLHEIKLNYKYCDDVLSGRKPFEVRYNDRFYQTGDSVRFIPVTDGGESVYHEISKWEFDITFVLSGFGLKENWVVFAIRKSHEISNTMVG